MRCPNCGKELPEGTRFCSECGYDLQQAFSQPQPQPQQSPTPNHPKKKHTALKVIGIVFGALILIGIIGTAAGGGKKTGTASQATTSKQTASATSKASSVASNSAASVQESKSTATPTPTSVPTSAMQAYETDLTPGNYVSGTDIPSGKYNVTIVSGSGNVYSSNMYTGGMNAALGTDTSTGLYSQSFNGCSLPDGTILCVLGTATVHITTDSADPSSVAQRTPDEASAITLNAGNYTAGTDIPEGVYNIEAVDGMGNINSSNMYNGGINEILGTDTSNGMAISSFKNLELPSGTTITITGVSVKFIPVK